MTDLARDRTLDLVDMVKELCDPIEHREHYGLWKSNGDGKSTWYGQNHTTQHPSLLVQLDQATHQATQTDTGSRPGYTSTPTARLDALDALVQIDATARHWLKQLNADDAGDTATVVRRLASTTEPPWTYAAGGPGAAC